MRDLIANKQMDKQTDIILLYMIYMIYIQWTFECIITHIPTKSKSGNSCDSFDEQFHNFVGFGQVGWLGWLA